MIVIPSAPAGTSVTRVGSWYRQENTKRSEISSSDTAEAKNSRQARASSCVGPVARLRSTTTQPASPATVQSTSTGPGAYPPSS